LPKRPIKMFHKELFVSLKKTARTLLAGTLAIALATPSVFAATTSSAQVVETVHGWVSVHTQAKLRSPIVGRLQLGDKAPLIAKSNAYWYEIKLNGRDVYITTNTSFTHLANGSGSAATTTQTSSSKIGTSRSNTAGSASRSGTPTSGWQTEADKLVATAKTQLGVPYLWGHQSPGVGFDCSNFTAWSYRTALGIAFSGSSVTQRYAVGTPISLSNIRAGDLLFFKTRNNPTGGGHVGIYIGNGKVIQEGGGWGKVTIEPLQGTWLGTNLVFARRVIQ